MTNPIVELGKITSLAILIPLLVAQLHLPPEDRCSLEFMGQLLRGEKKALHNDKIKTVKVTDKKYITVKRVAEQVKNNQVYMQYLPDHPATAGRAFLFTIVNTLDPEYFRRATAEVERRRIAKTKEEKEEEVEICPEMEGVLNEYVDLSADRKACPQSLAMLKLGAKKRKKADRKPVPELAARIK